ncbi:MAG TPA: CcmD family protein [Thermoanaerobaculia bacterium]
MPAPGSRGAEISTLGVGVTMASGGIAWVVAVNLIIWTGLFLYLLRLGKRLREMEKEP